MGAADIKKWRRELQSGERQIRRGVNDAANGAKRRYERVAKENIINNDAVASTELFRGINGRTTRYRTSATARLVSRAPHSGYVEHGTGAKGDGTYPQPGNPSTVTIAQWMIEKPTMNPGAHLWPRARHIAQNISEEGVSPQPFFYDAVESGFDTAFGSMMLTLDDAIGFNITTS